MSQSLEEFRHKLAVMANANISLMRGMDKQAAFRHVKAVIAKHRVVFAVWPDLHNDDGIATHIIKGRQELQALAASRAPKDVSIAAIPCISYEQAIAAEVVLGDGIN
jgi:hypothetical protein